MKIACVGNCQLESLAWYIKYLLPNDECWWLSFNEERYKGYNLKKMFNKVNYKIFKKEFIDNVRCPHNQIDYLKSCDYLIYMILSEESSPDYHSKKIKTYLRDNCKSLSVTKYYININDYDKTLQGAISRDTTGRVQITTAKIINQNNKNEMSPLRETQLNHPPSNYFLKLLELICNHFEWDYFSKEDHEMFLKLGFPHGVNLR